MRAYAGIQCVAHLNSLINRNHKDYISHLVLTEMLSARKIM